MKSSRLSILLCAVLIISACSKSSDASFIQISPDNAFSSVELSNQLGTGINLNPNIDFSDHDFDHYLVLSRSKMFSNSDEWFSKDIIGSTANTQSSMELNIASTSIESYDRIIAYSFSNDHRIVLYDDVKTVELPPTLFNEVALDLTIGDDHYKGHFPEPGTLKSALTEDWISPLSISGNKKIHWQPTANPTDKIRLFIRHSGTVNGTELLPTREFTIDDTGSLILTEEMLSGYQSQDQIHIALFRDIFILQDKLLIRSIEEQKWDFITLTD